MHLTLPFLATGKNLKTFTFHKPLKNGSVVKQSISSRSIFMLITLVLKKVLLRNTSVFFFLSSFC